MIEIPPIPCTLDRGEMPQRVAEMRALGRAGLQDVSRGERQLTLHFRRDPAIREHVERIVAAESRCCAFLDFTLADEKDAIVLTIAAPEGAEPALQGLADLFAADIPPAGIGSLS
jgi:hypothetical protein